MARAAMLTDVRTIEICDVPDPSDLAENEMLVNTLYSGISRGTRLQSSALASPHGMPAR